MAGFIGSSKVFGKLERFFKGFENEEKVQSNPRIPGKPGDTIFLKDQPTSTLGRNNKIVPLAEEIEALRIIANPSTTR